MATAQLRLRRTDSGNYRVTGHDGNDYSVEKDYGVGTTFRGWSAFRWDGGKWVGTRFSGNTLREVKRQMVAAGVIDGD